MNHFGIKFVLNSLNLASFLFEQFTQNFMKFGKTLLLFLSLILFNLNFIKAQPDSEKKLSSFADKTVVVVDLYPNPASDFLNIQINEPSVKNVKFELYNIIGSAVPMKGEKLENNKFKLETGDLTPGYYLLVIQDDNSKFKHTYKFLKK